MRKSSKSGKLLLTEANVGPFFQQRWEIQFSSWIESIRFLQGGLLGRKIGEKLGNNVKKVKVVFSIARFLEGIVCGFSEL